MLKIVRLSIESTSRTDDNEVIGGISVKSGGTIDRLDVWRKLTKSKSQT